MSRTVYPQTVSSAQMSSVARSITDVLDKQACRNLVSPPARLSPLINLAGDSEKLGAL